MNEPVCFANPEDLVNDGYSHTFRVFSNEPGTGSKWVPLYRQPYPPPKFVERNVLAVLADLCFACSGEPGKTWRPDRPTLERALSVLKAHGISVSPHERASQAQKVGEK